MRRQRSGLPPPVYISRIRIIKCHISISLRGDKFMQLHIYISTDKETTDIVIFRIAHFKKRRFAIVTGRSIIFHFLATARNFGNRFRTVICLPQIIGRIHVEIRITIGIQTRSMIVNILLRVIGGKTIVKTCLIIKGHILCRTQIFRV